MHKVLFIVAVVWTLLAVFIGKQSLNDSIVSGIVLGLLVSLIVTVTARRGEPGSR